MSIQQKVYKVNGAVFGVKVSTYDENGVTRGGVRVEHLWGAYPSWNDVIAALWWAKDSQPGEGLYADSKEASLHRIYPWRVEKRKGMSGCLDFLVRVQDETTKEWGTAGVITSSLHVSCKGTTPFLSCPIEDFWIYVDEVPCMEWEELKAKYELCPPVEIECGREFEWNQPGMISGHEEEEEAEV